MKQIMAWASPDKKFDEETKVLVKVQIDNSLQLGWKDKDILLFTNFPYVYGRIKAKMLPNNAYCSYMPISTKLTSLMKIFEMGYIKKNTLYWVHDFDCYQLHRFKRGEIRLRGVDMALCDYGRKKNKWSGGSIFFTSKAKDIFKKQLEIAHEYKCVDETALLGLTRNNPKICARIKKLNSTYHFLPFNIINNYRFADKPIRIAHFHPYKCDRRVQPEGENLFQFYCGKNKARIKLIPNRLIHIFKRHGMKFSKG